MDQNELNQWLAYPTTQKMLSKLQAKRIEKLEFACDRSRIDTDPLTMRMLINEAYVYKEVLQLLQNVK